MPRPAPGVRQAAAAATCAAALALNALPAAAKPAGRTLGYVINVFQHAANDGADDCPDGLNLGQKEVYLNSVPPAERARLLRPESKAEFMTIIYGHPTNINGSPKHNRCVAPLDFPDPGLKTLQGREAKGMDLDGGDTSAAAAPGTCQHGNFTSPDGQPGIDNQHWRALGCIRMYRPGQDVHKVAVSAIRNGEMAILLEVADVDDPQNDDQVTVGLYSSSDPVPTDGAGNVVTAGSLQVHDDKRFHNRLRGRIRDGVLTTEPDDVHLQLRMGPVNTEWWFRSARLKVALKGDTAEGMLAAYADVETLYTFTAQGTVDGAVVGGYTCPGIYGALHRLADGYPDPRTGACTAISTAWELAAVRGYVIHPEQNAGLAPAAQVAAGPAGAR